MFQLEYESTNVSHWTYEIGACGGRFTTSNGILTSPFHPGNYPNNADCNYTISQPADTVILLKFINMYIEGDSDGRDVSCDLDYLEIRDGLQANSSLLDKLCGKVIPSSIQSSKNHIWLR